MEGRTGAVEDAPKHPDQHGCWNWCEEHYFESKTDAEAVVEAEEGQLEHCLGNKAATEVVEEEVVVALEHCDPQNR